MPSEVLSELVERKTPDESIATKEEGPGIEVDAGYIAIKNTVPFSGFEPDEVVVKESPSRIPVGLDHIRFDN